MIFDNWKYAKLPYFPPYLTNKSDDRLMENLFLLILFQIVFFFY